MIAGILIIIVGLVGVALGAAQLRGAFPQLRRAGPFPSYGAYLNLGAGIFLIALGALRIGGLL